MQLTYQLAAQDFLAFQLYTASQSLRVRRLRDRRRVGFAVVFLLTGVLLLWLHRQLAGFAYIGCAVVWLLGYPRYHRWHYRRHYKNFIADNYQERIGKTTTMDLDDDFIRVAQEGSESRVAISEVQWVVEVPAAFYIRLKGTQSFILPKAGITVEAVRTRLKEIAEGAQIAFADQSDWNW